MARHANVHTVPDFDFVGWSNVWVAVLQQRIRNNRDCIESGRHRDDQPRVPDPVQADPDTPLNTHPDSHA